MTTKFMLDTRSAGKDKHKLCPITLLVSHQGKRLRFSLNNKISQGNWDSKERTAKGSTQECYAVRTEIYEKSQIIDDIIIKYRIKNRGATPPLSYVKQNLFAELYQVDPERIPRLEEEEKSEARRLIPYILKMADHKKGIDSYHTIKKYHRVADSVREFCHYETRSDLATLINNEWLTEYVKFLVYKEIMDRKGKPIKKRVHNSTAESCLSKIKATARHYGLPIIVNMRQIMMPFKKNQEDHSEMAYCTMDEVSNIYNFDCNVFPEHHRQGFEAARDCWVFCAFTGLRSKELFFLKSTSVQERFGVNPLSDDKEMVSYKVLVNDSTKTRHRSEVPLNETCLEIISKWKRRSFKVIYDQRAGEPIVNTDPLLPVRNSQNLNEAITTIMKKSGGPFNRVETVVRYSGTDRIEKQIPRYEYITFHSARHTYGCHLINKGVDIYTVGKLLGHKSIKTTEKYYAKVEWQAAAFKALDVLTKIM